MGTIDNSISMKMDMAELLQLMELIATSLITSQYITDFTVHDTNFIRTNVGKPFVWMVYNSGTHIYAADNIQDVRHFKKMLDHYENYSHADFCLYRYDGDKLFPIFPKTAHILTNSELTKLQTIKN
jgi:hypothetical protein